MIGGVDVELVDMVLDGELVGVLTEVPTDAAEDVVAGVDDVIVIGVVDTTLEVVVELLLVVVVFIK